MGFYETVETYQKKNQMLQIDPSRITTSHQEAIFRRQSLKYWQGLCFLKNVPALAVTFCAYKNVPAKVEDLRIARSHDQFEHALKNLYDVCICKSDYKGLFQRDLKETFGR